MASPVKLYQQEIHDNLGFFPTWLPGDPVEVGDAGVLEGGRFRRLLSLRDVGIACDVSEHQATQNVQYTSTKGTKVTTSAGVSAATLTRAEISIEFSQQSAFIFHASNLRPRRLENRIAVAKQILDAYKKNKWKKEWLLVEAIHTAELATIIVSEDKSGGLVLIANADAELPALSLADPKISLTVASTRGKIIHIIGGKGLNPLYSCLRLKDPLFGGERSLDPVRGAGAVHEDSTFIRPPIDELLSS